MVIMFCGAVVMAGTFLFIPLYLQLVMGLTPLHAGLWMLPQAIAMIGSTQLTPILARRFRPAHIMAVALAIAALGCVLLAFTTVGGLPLLVTGFLLACVGVAPPTALGTELVINSVPPAQAGSAASVSETSNELGIALGLAVLGSVGTIVYRGAVTVPAEVPAEVAGESMAGAVATAADLPAPLATELLTSAREAFTAGLNTVATVGAIIFTAIAVVALVTLRHKEVPVEEPTKEPAPN